MIRVLCCWEIGAGYGHLFRIVPLVKEFQKKENEVLLVSKDLARAKSIFDYLEITCFQAPSNQAPPRKFPNSINYAQNLLRNGFWHAPSLRAKLREWLDLYEKIQPDIILAEHAPVALLAARLAGLSRAAIGTGFTIPPFVSPMPTIQPWFPVSQNYLIQAEREFLSHVNPVLLELGSKPLEVVADIFDGVEPFLCTFPELDHYDSRADVHYYGPIAYTPPQQKPDWPDAKGKKVFVYMRTNNRNFENTFQVLQQMPVTVLACVPDISKSVLHSQQRPHLHITTEPVDLIHTARDCSLMISQGGTNSGTIMLLSGVPVLIFPKEIEQTMWALKITRQGLGSMINPFNPVPDIMTRIEEALHSDVSGSKIRKFTQRYAHYESQQTVQKIANRITIMTNK